MRDIAIPNDYADSTQVNENHGDVCRPLAETPGDLGVGFECPGKCVGRDSAPYCMTSSTDESACRFGKMLLTNSGNVIFHSIYVFYSAESLCIKSK